jgi:ketosteroid isomerase-like protein
MHRMMRIFCLALACFVALVFAIPAPAQTQSSSSSGSSDKAKIEALYQQLIKACNAKDVNGIMAHYDPNELFVFDLVPPREYPSWDAYKKDWDGVFTSMPGPMEISISNLAITVVGPVAYARSIQSGYFTAQDGSRADIAVRVTDVLRKVKGKWLIVQEHASVPVDLASGKADLMSKP